MFACKCGRDESVRMGVWGCDQNGAAERAEPMKTRTLRGLVADITMRACTQGWVGGWIARESLDEYLQRRREGDVCGGGKAAS